MGLIYSKHINKQTKIAVWHVKEDVNFFLPALDLDTKTLEKVEAMRPHRKLEWLASRYLLRMLINPEQRLMLQKDEYGKPFHTSCQVSISHSREMVAAIIAPKRVGIDIQLRDPKIKNIFHKFISPEELSHIEDHHLDYYHIFWGAKEAMYKAWGKKKLAFKQHMYLYPFKYFRKDIELSGVVSKENNTQLYNIYTDLIKSYYLVYCIEK